MYVHVYTYTCTMYIHSIPWLLIYSTRYYRLSYRTYKYIHVHVHVPVQCVCMYIVYLYCTYSSFTCTCTCIHVHVCMYDIILQCCVCGFRVPPEATHFTKSCLKCCVVLCCVGFCLSTGLYFLSQCAIYTCNAMCSTCTCT